jgi:hypothetical protein
MEKFIDTFRCTAISMQENLQNYKHREPDKKEEISPLVDGWSHNYAEKDKHIKENLPENYK